MNILMIGNSYTVDCSRYLHRIARAGGAVINTTCLYIGGCPLDRHFRNMHSGEEAYELYANGEPTGFKVSLGDALVNREWDVITFQQASFKSFDYETYQPYLEKLAEYVRQYVPKAKLVVHQTWAYEQGSERLQEKMGYSDYHDMLEDIVKAYGAAAQSIQADYIIPSGEVFRALLENGVPTVHRDTYHASRGLGRYALGLAWYRFLTGKDISNNTFRDFDEEISTEEIALAKKCVEEIAAKYGR